MTDPIDAKRMYEILQEEAKQEGIGGNEFPHWENLFPAMQIAYGRLCRRLQRDHGLAGRESGEQMMNRLQKVLAEENFERLKDGPF